MNIYNFDRRLLMIPPLLLILVSLYFIPQIKMGVDFRGGTLISMRMEDADIQSLQAVYAPLGGEVTVSPISEGYSVEVLIPLSEEDLRMEELRERFNSLFEETVELEIRSYTGEVAQLDEKKQELKAILREAAALSSSPYTQPQSLNEMEDLFLNYYNNYFKNKMRSIQSLTERNFSYRSLSIERVSPLLSAQFISSVINAALIATVLSSIIVFLFFRTLGPTLAVLIGALSDIIFALGAMGAFGIPFTLVSFAALMMLVGYSLDTDILLTSRVVKRGGDPKENAYDAMKTGLTMSLTGLIAFVAIFLVGLVGGVSTYFEIAGVAIAGLVGDMFATWGINAVLLLWLKEGRK